MKAIITKFDIEFYKKEYQFLYTDFFGEDMWEKRKEYLKTVNKENDLELLCCGIEYLSNAIEKRESDKILPKKLKEKRENSKRQSRTVYNEWKKFRTVETVTKP